MERQAPPASPPAIHCEPHLRIYATLSFRTLLQFCQIELRQASASAAGKIPNSPSRLASRAACKLQLGNIPPFTTAVSTSPAIWLHTQPGNDRAIRVLHPRHVGQKNQRARLTTPPRRPLPSRPHSRCSTLQRRPMPLEDEPECLPVPRSLRSSADQPRRSRPRTRDRHRCYPSCARERSTIAAAEPMAGLPSTPNRCDQLLVHHAGKHHQRHVPSLCIGHAQPADELAFLAQALQGPGQRPAAAVNDRNAVPVLRQLRDGVRALAQYRCIFQRRSADLSPRLSLQSLRLIPAVHDVHVLHRLSGRPLQQVVDARDITSLRPSSARQNPISQ